MLNHFVGQRGTIFYVKNNYVFELFPFSSFLAVLVADLEVKSPVISITREYLGANLGANLDRSVITN